MLVLQGIGTAFGIGDGTLRFLRADSDFHENGNDGAEYFRAGSFGGGVGRTVLAAEHLSPAVIALLDTSMVSAFVLREGSQNSHDMIFLRSLGIPAVTNLGIEYDRLKEGARTMVDGDAGSVTQEPDMQTISQLAQKMLQAVKDSRNIQIIRGLPATTEYGIHVNLCANISTAAQAKQSLRFGVDGVGLFRTEFLFTSGDTLPDEDTQFHAYQEALLAMGDKRVVVRLIDFGSDKATFCPEMDVEANPALGFHTIPYSVMQHDILFTQLRALWRASLFGNLAIMLPMVTSTEEVYAVRMMMDEAKATLDESLTRTNANLPLGILVETPAAALTLDLFINKIDFVCIGTNDLAQYVLAIDRNDPSLYTSYNAKHPAVLRLVAQVVRTAHTMHLPVSVCGEIAGDPSLAGYFTGMGVSELSMATHKIPQMKKAIRALSIADCRAALMAALDTPAAPQFPGVIKPPEVPPVTPPVDAPIAPSVAAPVTPPVDAPIAVAVAAQVVNKTVAVEASAPVLEKTTPVIEKIIPIAEDTLPAVEDLAPVAEKIEIAQSDTPIFETKTPTSDMESKQAGTKPYAHTTIMPSTNDALALFGQENSADTLFEDTEETLFENTAEKNTLAELDTAEPKTVELEEPGLDVLSLDKPNFDILSDDEATIILSDEPDFEDSEDDDVSDDLGFDTVDSDEIVAFELASAHQDPAVHDEPNELNIEKDDDNASENVLLTSGKYSPMLFEDDILDTPHATSNIGAIYAELETMLTDSDAADKSLRDSAFVANVYDVPAIVGESEMRIYPKQSPQNELSPNSVANEQALEAFAAEEDDANKPNSIAANIAYFFNNDKNNAADSSLDDELLVLDNVTTVQPTKKKNFSDRFSSLFDGLKH